MTRAARLLSVVLWLFALASAAGIWIGIPYLERRWTYIPVKESPEEPWELPDGAVKVSFLTADGVRLSGWFFEGVAPGNGITVLLLHGNHGVLHNFVYEAEILRKRGFRVLLFNYRGFGMSDGETESEGTLDRDARAAVHYLTHERGIDPLSIAFVGGSLGAPIAANLAADAPCRAVSLASPFASAKQQAQIARPWLPEIVLDNLASPLDTVGAIREARCPVLVVHSATDTVVPLGQAREIYDAAPWPKRFIVLPEGGHGFEGENRAVLLDAMMSFILNPQ